MSCASLIRSVVANSDSDPSAGRPKRLAAPTGSSLPLGGFKECLGVAGSKSMGSCSLSVQFGQ